MMWCTVGRLCQAEVNVASMSYVGGASRAQRILFPEALDEYIGEDNAVRFIDAYVDGLHMEELGFKQTAPKETGRPPYDPRDLLKLYIYGYLNRLRTSRMLEREWEKCGADVADAQASAGFQNASGFSKR